MLVRNGYRIASHASGLIAAFALTAMTLATTHQRTWRANTFTHSTQAEATIIVNADDDITFAWSSRRQHGGRYGVYAQRFTSDGTPIGSETALMLWDAGHQTMPALANATDDAVWAVWESFGQDGDAGAIIARRFSIDNGRLTGGDELLINDQTARHQTSPGLLALDDGSMLVHWTDRCASTGEAHVRTRCIRRDGSMNAGSIVMSGTDEAPFTQQQAGACLDGAPCIVAAAFDRTHRPHAIVLHRPGVDSDPLIVSDDAAQHPIEPTVAINGTMVLVGWLEVDPEGQGHRAVHRTIDLADADDPILRPIVRMTNARGTRIAGLHAVPRGDGFTLAWNQARAREHDVMMMHVARTGVPEHEPFAALTSRHGARMLAIGGHAARMATTSDNRVLLAWDGDAGLGDNSAVHVTGISATPWPETAAIGVQPDMTAVPLTYVARRNGPAPHTPPAYDPVRATHGAARTQVLGPGTVGFDGILDTGWNPPDPTMAVGPEHIVAMTNGGIAFLSKTGQVLFEDSINGSFGFWGSLNVGDFVFDPEVLWDPYSNRFFAMAAESTGPQSFMLLAVSDDDNPIGNWNRFRIETTNVAGDNFDSPNMSVDQNVLYITGDGLGGPFGYPVFTFEKADLIDGGTLTPAQSANLTTSTLSAGIPAVMEPGAPGLYLIEHEEGFSNDSVRLIAVVNPLTSLRFETTTISVPTYGRPIDPVHLGTSEAIESFDARFWSVDSRNGSLWATHHVSTPSSGTVIVRWYEIAMNGWPISGQSPTLLQAGTIDPGGSSSAYFSAIGADDEGRAAVVYAASSPSTTISMMTSSRDADAPPSTMANATTWQTNTTGCGGGRWGDDARVQADPVDGSFWVTHEYAIGGVWRTWIQNIAPPPPPNNVCVSAALIAEGDNAFSTINATTSLAGESCAELQNDIWYRFIASEPGILRIRTCASDFDSQLALYSFLCPGSPGEALACSDDACGDDAEVTWNVAAATLFRIRVGGPPGASGTGTLSITLEPDSDTPCPADCSPDNGDGTFGNGIVNVDDLFAVINSFGATGGPCDAAPDNGDGTFGNGVVNVDDLFAVLNAFGDCPD